MIGGPRGGWLGAFAYLSFFLCLVAGCGAANHSEARTVSLLLQGAPPEATVTIDDQLVGTLDVVAARGVALPPGTHRISIEAPGYFPRDQLVLAGESPIHLEIQLTKIPD